MGQEYDGRVDNIGLPDLMLFEVGHYVTVEPNFKGQVTVEGEYLSGSRLKINIDLFERYFRSGRGVGCARHKVFDEEHGPWVLWRTPIENA